jgi:hypothetical protein
MTVTVTVTVAVMITAFVFCWKDLVHMSHQLLGGKYVHFCH